MVTRIDELTPEQEAQLDGWAEKWIKIGLCTDPADRPTFERAVKACYREAGLAEPTSVEWVASPLAMRRRVEALGGDWRRYFGGQFWAGGWWGSPSFVSFFTDVCELDLGEDAAAAKAYRETCESACWWWGSETTVVVSERPSCIHTDEAGRLHCTTGPAIAWRDDEAMSIHAYHGVEVSPAVIARSYGVADIRAEKNAEIRRVMIELFGLARWVTESGAVALHTDEYGTLFDLDGDRVVRVRDDVDGGREFWLPVDAELRPLLGGDARGEPQALTARNAVASTFGLRGEEYRPDVES